MKLVTLLILLICLSAITSRRVHHRARHHHRQSKNGAYQFFLGFIQALSGAENLIDSCTKLVPGWESATDDEEKSGDSTDNQVASQQSTFQLILPYLTKAIDAVCNFKEKIITYLTGKFRRYIRLFLQGKTRKRFRLAWFLSGMWDSIVSVASDIGEAVVSGAKAVGNTIIKAGEWVGKKVEDLYNFVKEQIGSALQPVFDLFDQLKPKIIAWLQKSPLLAKLIAIGQCLYENDAVKGIKGIYNTLKAMVEIIPKLATPAGWVELIVNLVCSWENLKNGIQALIAGIAEKDKLIKYNFYGKFTGFLFRAIASQ